ncbi:hypothetical protein BH23CHL5_BH23CHL5_25410 [soil metagenome]
MAPFRSGRGKGWDRGLWRRGDGVLPGQYPYPPAPFPSAEGQGGRIDDGDVE